MVYRAIALPLILSSPALAQSTTWIGPASGDWFDEANWSQGIPNSTTRAVFDSPGALDLLIDLTPAFAQGLTITSGQVQIHTLDALADLRLDQTAGAAPTLEVIGNGTSAIVSGDLALGSAKVRGGASLTLQGRVNALREITVESGLASSSLQLVDAALSISQPVLRLDGQFSQTVLFEDFSAPDSQVTVSKPQATQGDSQIILRRAVAREFFMYADVGAGPSTVNVYFPSSFSVFGVQGADLDVVGDLRVASLSDTRYSGFVFQRGDIRVHGNASVTIDDCNLIGGDATLHVEPGGRFAAQSGRWQDGADASVALDELVISGGGAFFGSRLGAKSEEHFNVPAFYVVVASEDPDSQGLQLTGGRLETHGVLRIYSPVQILASEVVQLGGRRRFATFHTSLHSALVFGGINSGTESVSESRVDGSTIIARDLIVARDMSVSGGSDYSPEVRAETMWIGDGVLRLLADDRNDPVTRVEVETLVVGGWTAIGNSSILITNSEPTGVLAGDGVIAGRLINAGLLDPGSGIGRITVDGAYEQRATLAPKAPRSALLQPDGGFKQIDAGRLLIDLIATDPLAGHDMLVVDGDAFLGGTLELRYPDGDPADGVYEIVSATRIDGEFETIEAPPLSGGRTARVSYTATSVLVRVGVEGDVTGDGVVNGQDIAAWMTLRKAGEPAADVNGDGVIDNADLAAILANWTRSEGRRSV